ncbi:hypothetical protein MRS44_008804 [Fusarium solani]|uniref:uncharacterized protein n=1 Tax=Fusarium solani TaxID=169388 RepID=UPI0032C3E35C|nr:hypothetical protein MRS44_008804 [Fusarium solani]
MGSDQQSGIAMPQSNIPPLRPTKQLAIVLLLVLSVTLCRAPFRASGQNVGQAKTQAHSRALSQPHRLVLLHRPWRGPSQPDCARVQLRGPGRQAHPDGLTPTGGGQATPYCPEPQRHNHNPHAQGNPRASQGAWRGGRVRREPPVSAYPPGATLQARHYRATFAMTHRFPQPSVGALCES